MNLIYPQPGYVEIDPEELWQNVVEVIRGAIRSKNNFKFRHFETCNTKTKTLDADLIPSQITCLGVSTQRASFVTWRKDNGKPLHNFITWKDLRADQLAKNWNGALWMKALKSSSYILYLFTRNKRFLAGSGIKVANNHVSTSILCFYLM